MIFEQIEYRQKTYLSDYELNNYGHQKVWLELQEQYFQVSTKLLLPHGQNIILIKWNGFWNSWIGHSALPSVLFTKSAAQLARYLSASL